MLTNEITIYFYTAILKIPSASNLNRIHLVRITIFISQFTSSAKNFNLKFVAENMSFIHTETSTNPNMSGVHWLQRGGQKF